MAKNDEFLIANPTLANITVDGTTVNAGQVKVVTIEDEAKSVDLATWVCKGCCVATATKANATATVTDAVDNECQLVEKGARLLESMTRAVLSAGSDAFAAAGL